MMPYARWITIVGGLALAWPAGSPGQDAPGQDLPGPGPAPASAPAPAEAAAPEEAAGEENETAAAAIPPLTRRQRDQLATTADFVPHIDEGALYPLLENASQWPAGAESGARVPDYAALYDDPGAARGERFLIEGRLGRSGAVDHLARPGPWTGKIKRWAIGVPDVENAILVYLVDPPSKTPLYGSKVRTVARFYKVFSSKDMNNEAQRFLVFVGRDARVIEGASGNGPGTPMAGMAVALAVLAIGYWWIRSQVSAKPLATRRTHASETGADEMNAAHASAEAEAEEPALPEDPAEALANLRGRAEQNDAEAEAEAEPASPDAASPDTAPAPDETDRTP